MRIKVLHISLVCSTLAVLLISCLGSNEVDYEYDSAAGISSFAIANIVTTIIEDEDTTKFTVTGTNYKFSIDQLPSIGKIYNNDSLPVNTDVTKVAFTMVTTPANRPVSYTLKDIAGEDSLCWVSSTDSLNFTEPIIFTVYAWDGVHTKDYEVKINVHQQVPDSMTWNKQVSNFPGNVISGKQKAILFQNRVLVFAEDASQVKVTSTSVNDGIQWSALTTINGISDKADYSSVLTFADKLYILSEANKVYSSTDGINWRDENAEATGLVGTLKNELWGINNNQFIKFSLINNSLTQQETGISVPEQFPVGNYKAVNEPLVTNPNIERLSVTGEMPSASDTATVVWNILSNENKWISYTPTNSYYFPNLENLSFIPYDGYLYAFGGKDKSNKKAVKPFENIYYSKDNGKTWLTFKEYVSFPEELIGKEAAYSSIVDDENFIWLLFSGENSIWKGRINRLGFAK